MVGEGGSQAGPSRADATRRLEGFRAAPGDLVLAAGKQRHHEWRGPEAGGEPSKGDWEPAGEVERVLETAHGIRLVVQCAFFRGRFVIVAGNDIEWAGIDPLGLRWIRLRIDPATLLARGIYQRVMGRLTVDARPLPHPPPRLDDEAVRAELGAALAAHPLLVESELTLHVSHGVAVVDGWVRTVGAKVATERIARETRGVWAVRNRLVSDEELRAAARRQLAAMPELARATDELRLDLGQATLVLHRGLSPEAVAAAEQLLRQLPGMRQVAIVQ